MFALGQALESLALLPTANQGLRCKEIERHLEEITAEIAPPCHT